MPAAAVIPAPIAYIKVVAVKKLVVGSTVLGLRSFISDVLQCQAESFGKRLVLFIECQYVAGTFTLKKLKCSKQAYA